MRKTLLALSLTAATAVALATPSVAQDRYHHRHHHGHYVAPVTGAVAGTVAGVGLYHGWYTVAGTSAAASSVAGSIAAGGIAGVGTIAAIDAVTTPCRGFHALFGGSGCVNGEYVGPQAMYGPRGHVR